MLSTTVAVKTVETPPPDAKAKAWRIILDVRYALINGREEEWLKKTGGVEIFPTNGGN
jgi:hypothetical protein